VRREQAIAAAGRVLDAWMPLRRAYAQVPAISIGIVSKGKLAYARGFGYADLASRTDATEQTCYRIASNSKTFTAVAIMQLVEQGSLALDDTIASHLRWFRPSGKTGSPITIRQALSHSAGVYRDATSPHWDNDEFPDLASLKRQATAAGSGVFENNTRWKYSNFGFALLGEVIKKVSGQAYASYMRENIIEPLGLERTEPELTKASREWLATPYSRPLPESDLRDSFEHANTRAYASATGFLSNVPDLATYIGALSLGDDRLLGRESKKEMFRPHWETGEDGVSYGLGFIVSKVGKRTVVGHGGGFPGFITNQAFDPTDDLGVIVLTNSNDSPAVFLRTGIFRMIDRFMSDGDRYRSTDTATTLAPYEGLYRGRWVDMCVVRVVSSLIAFPVNVDAPMSAATTLRRKGKHSFVMDSKFNSDSPGELARFTVSGERATKMTWGANPFVRLP
jgi:D-alanyl-D-alanine carboxypeptidase